MWSWWVVLSNTNEKTAQNKNKVRPVGRTLPKTTDDNDMYSREFPNGNFLFFFAGEMSLFRLPRGKLPLSFLAVPAGKDGCSHRQVRTMSRVWGGTASAKHSGVVRLAHRKCEVMAQYLVQTAYEGFKVRYEESRAQCGHYNLLLSSTE